MMVMRKRGKGQPEKSYRDTTGKTHPGLTRAPDGRWRYFKDGKEVRFTEEHEARAIARFYRAVGDGSVAIVSPVYHPETPAIFGDTVEGELLANVWPSNPRIQEAELWAWCREQLLLHPETAARMTGIPELARLSDLPDRKPALSLELILGAFVGHSKATPKHIADSRRSWGLITKGLTSESDLTKEHIVGFRLMMEKKYPNPVTRSGQYKRIKNVVNFGHKKMGLELETLSLRLQMLFCDDVLPEHRPEPMTKENWVKLFAGATSEWKLRMLLGLNLCLHMVDVYRLKWASFDLAKGTYMAIRTKTQKKGRCQQVAALWPETIAALVGHTGGDDSQVFRGTGLGAWRNAFKALGDSLGVDQRFDCLRDGAYGIAANVNLVAAKHLAGHSLEGHTDSYVKRLPGNVVEVCERVREYYLG